MTNEELELIINTRVEAALKKQQEEKKKSIIDDNILLNEYCRLNRINKDSDDLDHIDNVKFLKKSWKKFITKDPEFQNEKSIVAQKLGTITRLLDYDLEKWMDEQEDD